jgi:hypothetical protein
VTDGTVPSRADRVTRRTYVGVFVAEVLVLFAIWLVQRYFGSP